MTERTVGPFVRHRTNASSGWLSLMAEAYSIRSALYFSARHRFDDELRPLTEDGARIAYPDAIYHITQADLDRAKGAINVR
jgi:hypothetical protein